MVKTVGVVLLGLKSQSKTNISPLTKCPLPSFLCHLGFLDPMLDARTRDGEARRSHTLAFLQSRTASCFHYCQLY